MGTQSYKVTGPSGQSEVIEAARQIDAVAIFVEHHGEHAVNVVQVQAATIHEKDTARG